MSFSDWLLRPLSDDPNAARGHNNLGLIGAALKDAGMHLNGEETGALDSFQARARRPGLQKQKLGPQQPLVSEFRLKPFAIQPPTDMNAQIRELITTLP
jgi:hypothetical protein